MVELVAPAVAEGFDVADLVADVVEAAPVVQAPGMRRGLPPRLEAALLLLPDLRDAGIRQHEDLEGVRPAGALQRGFDGAQMREHPLRILVEQIGRASCRERGCQYV